MKNEHIEDNTGSNNEEEHRFFKKNFGQKVIEVFKREKDTDDIDTQYDKYMEKVQEERALLETLDAEQRNFQDYIFWRAIEKNPEASQFVKNLHLYSTSQLLGKNEDGSYKVSDETFGNFLEVYQNVLKEAEGEFEKDVEKIQSEYGSNLKDRVEAGKLPRQLYENYIKAKQKNSGSMVAATKLFDFRPTEDGAYIPAGADAFIQHVEINEMDENGIIINSEEGPRILYGKAFPTSYEKSMIKRIIGHELTHVIAGKEASFNLFPSKTGSVNMPYWKMDTEGYITMVFREGMTEAIGQMIMDSSPEASSRSLVYYLENEAGNERHEREFLASLIEIDKESESRMDNNTQESLEDIMLKAYTETDKSEYVDSLRRRLRYIFDGLEGLVKESLEKDEVVMNRAFSSSDVGAEFELRMRDKIREDDLNS